MEKTIEIDWNEQSILEALEQTGWLEDEVARKLGVDASDIKYIVPEGIQGHGRYVTTEVTVTLPDGGWDDG